MLVNERNAKGVQQQKYDKKKRVFRRVFCASGRRGRKKEIEKKISGDKRRVFDQCVNHHQSWSYWPLLVYAFNGSQCKPFTCVVVILPLRLCFCCLRNANANANANEDEQPGANGEKRMAMQTKE